MPTPFTPLAAFSGGVLIGLAAVLLMIGVGRIAGVSGIAARLLTPWERAAVGPAAFVSGLVLAALLARAFGLVSAADPAADLPTLLVGGLLVGAGTAIGGGCTSGHGVCGLARLSPRSLVAVLVFMVAAAATVFAVRHGWGSA